MNLMVNSVVPMTLVQEGLFFRRRTDVLPAQKKEGNKLVELTEEIISKNFKTKSYLHIDKRIHFEKVQDYVTNQDKIALHSFLPFIHYVDKNFKFTGEPNRKLNNRPVKEKTRKIMYAGHLDGFIYKYYSMILNSKYNDLMRDLGLDECSLAYRDNKTGESNITFAAEVINSLVYYKDSHILVGDFTSFFDNIDHRILKKKLLTCLRTNRMSNDWYNIFRSLTRHGYYEKELINEKCGSDKYLKKMKVSSYFKDGKKFREFQKENKTQSNTSGKGIPQGTAMSGVLANIAALDFDTEMKEIAGKYSGVYRRYSDDFILIIPQNQIDKYMDLNQFLVIIDQVRDLASKNGIELQEDKTDILLSTPSRVFDGNGKITYLDYLGFVFDGENVRMRAKSSYKFYRGAYNLIERAKKANKKKRMKNLPYRRRIYKFYTDLGASITPHGNFITYAKNAQKIFDEISPQTTNLMINQIKNRKKKIEKKLGIKIHSNIR